MQESFAATRGSDASAAHPMGPLLGVIGCTYGAPERDDDQRAWSVEEALDKLHAAGLDDVEVKRLPHDPNHAYYVCRPSVASTRGVLMRLVRRTPTPELASSASAPAAARPRPRRVRQSGKWMRQKR